MNDVDTRVVQMQFDNRQFEEGIQTSLNSIERLNKSVNSADSTKGMTGLATAVETVQARFSALQVVAMTALANITNSAVNSGKRILSSLTIDPIKTGFQEYETQINAIQTILANTESKGTTLDQVNTALDELNHYADKTIYNFTQMTKNIGTFTAAGIDLETSVSAIQGIANLAAVSGSTSQQASTAMYQLSQALSAGTVRLMDWNSVVNAGMGGQVFQDALKETARVHGIKIDEIIKKQGSFRNSLQTGWLTSEILTDTLYKFTIATDEMTEAQIEESRAMLKNKGYTDEQIEAIFKLGNTATQAATKVKTFTQLLETTKEAAQSGWTQSWEIIVGDFEEAKDIWTKISDVLNGFIGSSANARNELLQGWKDLGGRTAIIDALKNAFESIKRVIVPVKEAFRDMFPKTTADQLYAITIGLKNFTEKLKLSDTNSANLKRTAKGVFAVLSVGVDVVLAIARGFAELVGYLAPIGSGLLGITASIGDALVSFKNLTKSSNIIAKTFSKITLVLGTIIKGVRAFVTNVAEAIMSFATVDTSALDEFADRVNEKFKPMTKLGEGIRSFFNGVVNLLKKVAPVFLTLANFIGDIFSSLGEGILSSLSEGDLTPLIDIIKGVLGGSLLVALRNLINTLSDSVGVLSSIGDILEGWSLKIKAEALMKTAAAVVILAGALLLISAIDEAKLGGAMTAITGMFTELVILMSAFAKLSNGKNGIIGIGRTSNALMLMSLSILILASAMSKIAKLDWDGVVKGLVGVTGLVGVLVGASYAMQKVSKSLKKSASGMIAFSIAILILSSAVTKLGKLDVVSLTTGLIGVAVICTELAVFMKKADLDKMGLTKGLGLMTLATAINILASAVDKLGALDVTSLVKGLVAMGVIFAEIVGFLKFMGSPKKIISTSIGLTILGAAMLIFAEAIENMGSMSIQQIGHGLITMAASLALIIAAIKFIPKDILGTAVSLVVLSSALLILSNALSNMGGMTWEQFGIAMLTLAGSLTAIVVAMHFMTNALPGAAALLVVSAALSILAIAINSFGSQSLPELGMAMLTLLGVFVIFGAAAAILAPLTPVMLALGAAIALLGVGCAAVGAGILAFSAGLSALAVAGTAGAAALVAAVMSIISLIPGILEAVGKGIIALCGVIANGTAAICDAIASVIIAILDAIARTIPKFIDTVGVLLDSLLTFILSYIPKLINAGVQIIVSLLQGIAKNTSKIVSSAVSIVTNFLTALGKQLPKIVDAGFEMIISFIDGITKSIKTNLPRLRESAKELAFAIVDGMTGGLASKAKNVATKAAEMAKSALNAAKKALGINSPSKEFAELGRYSDEGLAYGLTKFAGNVAKSAANVGNTAIDSLNKSIKGVVDVVDGNLDTSPTIRPVVDLADAESGVKQLNGMFDSNGLIGIDATNARAAAIVSRMNSGGLSNDQSNQNGASFNFTQNNYSPKALSKTDIYRQTKNQISMMKGALQR